MIRRIIAAMKAALLTKETLIAVLFLIGLITYEAMVLDVSFRRYFDNFQPGHYVIFFGALLVVFTSWAWAAFFFRASFVSGYGLRTVYFVLFALAICCEYGYQRAFSRFSTVEDLRIALFDATKDQWIGSIAAYASWWAIFPCVAYAILLFSFRRQRNRGWFKLGLLFIVLIVFYSTISTYSSGEFTTISLNAFLRSAIMSPWRWASTYRGPREAIKSHPEHHPENNIIFVIDESVRADHLSINGYRRDTTPYLDELEKQGWLHNWGVAAAGATCSLSSDSLLVTGMNLNELPDTGFRILAVSNIFQYARAMGYQTHFLDGQKDTYWLGTAHDKAYVDDWRPASSFASTTPYERDASVAKQVMQITESSSGHFILVIKLGVHYPYAWVFPPSAAEWRPIETSERVDPARREELINTYDDALKYNLEVFFAALGIGNWQNRNILIYTSDHGQTLSEHGEQHTHCGSGKGTSTNEAMVPLFVVSREPLSVDTGYRASHANLFATLLDLMDFPASERHHPYAPSLLTAKARDSQPRYFWVGELSERILSTRLAFDR